MKGTEEDVNSLHLRQNCIIWPGHGFGRQQSQFVVNFKKGTKNCRVCWDSRFDNLAGGDCFSRVFLVSTSIGCQLHHNDEKRPFRLIVKVILKDLLIMTQLISRSWNFYPRIKMSKEVISLARKLRRVSEDHPPLFLVTHSVNCHNTWGCIYLYLWWGQVLTISPVTQLSDPRIPGSNINHPFLLVQARMLCISLRFHRDQGVIISKRKY